jgi:hypothetical protein
MVRTQIYLTRREHERIRRLARRTGRLQSEIIRAPIDRWFEQQANQGRDKVLTEVFGIPRGRTDLPDFERLCGEADRVTPPGRQ